MKTTHWILILAALLVVSLGASALFLLPGGDASRAEIRSGGQLVRIVDLQIDQEFTVSTPEGGHNTITVSGGKIAVTDASCPDHYCALRGFCSSGADIVCLPNALVIHFLGEQEIDMVVG